MGRTRGVASGGGGKRKGGQVRIDQMITPRRSTRRRSGTFEKQDDGLKVVELELSDDSPPVLELDTRPGKTITLKTDKKDAKVSQSVGNKRKAAVKKDVETKMSVEDQNELLKKFDINHIYGPCRGITRRERYQRALKYELRPPPDELVLKLLDERSGDIPFQKCIWDQNELLKLHM